VALRILLVDHSRETLDAMGTILSRARHQVACAQAAREALRVAGEFKPDVAIVDLEVPDMRGPELIGMLRQSRDGLSCLFVSRLGHEEADAEALRLGASDCLQSRSPGACCWPPWRAQPQTGDATERITPASMRSATPSPGGRTSSFGVSVLLGISERSRSSGARSACRAAGSATGAEPPTYRPETLSSSRVCSGRSSGKRRRRLRPRTC
jgi:CheY-like chemotaxis protein